MKHGPDLALIGSLIGDPGRANMLTALMSGKALTASELASEAGVTLQTASAHLARLTDGGLVRPRKQGRHRYFSLADDEVAAVLESMTGLAVRKGHTRGRTGPREPALRKARVCYDHLAGEMGVAMLDALRARDLIAERDQDLYLTDAGRAFVSGLGIDIEAIASPRRPMCKACLDWSARRDHLAGAMGAAILTRLYELGWAKRVEGTRIVRFSRRGEAAFRETFGLAESPA